MKTDKQIRKVAVAMSGGVDSGVAAALVVKAGFKAAGFHMRLWQESHLRGEAGPKPRGHLGGVPFENKCCSTESLEAARKTAHQLGMPFYTINLEKIFKKRVVDYFLKEYGLGRTPNPCVMCNRFIKFGELLAYARKLDYDYLATGHYARVVGDRKDEIGNKQYEIRNKKKNLSPISYRLLQALDKTKDQSYFLYNLTQKQLGQIMFPVGDYTKKQVIAMAKKWKLPVATRPESQEICFFPESDYRPFLRRQIGKKIVPGEVVDTKGRVIGRHKGIPLYTIGQRHGFTIIDKKAIGPLYVIRKDTKRNRLVVGFGKEAETKHFWVKKVNWIDPNFESRILNHELRCRVRIRHQGELLDCEIQTPRMVVAKSTSSEVEKRGKKAKVKLVEGERGVSPGQAAVFYERLETRDWRLETGTYEVLGGGIIADSI